MAVAPSTLQRESRAATVPGASRVSVQDAGRVLLGVASVLAVSGLAELFLQRIVYRVGVHIPRQGAFLEAYRFATVSGDFAFRTTAVLLAICAALAVVWLWARGSRVAASFLGALIAANLLAWPLGLAAGIKAAPMVFAFGAAWLVGQGLAGRGIALKLAVAGAGLAMVLAQYRAAMTGLGGEPGAVGLLQLTSEIALLAAAGFIAVAAVRRPIAWRPTVLSSLMTFALLASYAREPATVAIVSLWATGVTMSLPGLLYIAGFGAVVFAALTWYGSPGTRHLAIALALLIIAGLQPQALHHGITAFLGLALLNVRPGQFVAARDLPEVEHAA